MSFITGIQQIGIGVRDAPGAARLYKSIFGMEALVFDDTAEAALMTRYTGGSVYRRRAMLTLNLQGGGGFEIWQFLNREHFQAGQTTHYGDLGLYVPILKAPDVREAWRRLCQMGDIRVGEVQTGLQGTPQCWVEDRLGNTFLLRQDPESFQKPKGYTAGVLGAVIGVRDMERSLRLYQQVLGLNVKVSDTTGPSAGPDGQQQLCRRVVLRKEMNGKGAFSKLLGATELELVQALDRSPASLRQDCYWGDPGFIHLCFDVRDMDGLAASLQTAGYTFTVDSRGAFDMEGAAGRFCFLEDPDGMLIELVETHKVPILKRWRWYLDLKKRGLDQPLPNWMIRLLGWNKVR